MNLHTVQNLLIRFIQSPLVTKIAQARRSDARSVIDFEYAQQRRGVFTSYTVINADCEVRSKRRRVAPALPMEFALNQLKPAIPYKPANLMHRPQTIPAAPPLPPVGGKRLETIKEEPVQYFFVDPHGLERVCSMPLPPLPEPVPKVGEVKPKLNLLNELHKALLNKKKPVTPKNIDFTKFATVDLTNPVFTPPPEEFL